MRIRVSARAKSKIRAEDEWWRAERRDAPELFKQELAATKTRPEALAAPQFTVLAAVAFALPPKDRRARPPPPRPAAPRHPSPHARHSTTWRTSCREFVASFDPARHHERQLLFPASARNDF